MPGQRVTHSRLAPPPADRIDVHAYLKLRRARAQSAATPRPPRPAGQPPGRPTGAPLTSVTSVTSTSGGNNTRFEYWASASWFTEDAAAPPRDEMTSHYTHIQADANRAAAEALPALLEVRRERVMSGCSSGVPRRACSDGPVQPAVSTVAGVCAGQRRVLDSNPRGHLRALAVFKTCA
jgi:hypothetical protein